MWSSVREPAVPPAALTGGLCPNPRGAQGLLTCSLPPNTSEPLAELARGRGALGARGQRSVTKQRSITWHLDFVVVCFHNRRAQAFEGTENN